MVVSIFLKNSANSKQKIDDYIVLLIHFLSHIHNATKKDGLGSTVGAGIFVVYGVVANQIAGPAVVFSFLFAAFSSFLSALCYAEFAARIPLSGSAYTFAYMSMGEFIAWFIGWNLTLEYGVSAAAVARGSVVSVI